MEPVGETWLPLALKWPPLAAFSSSFAVVVAVESARTSEYLSKHEGSSARLLLALVGRVLARAAHKRLLLMKTLNVMCPVG